LLILKEAKVAKKQRETSDYDLLWQSF